MRRRGSDGRSRCRSGRAESRSRSICGGRQTCRARRAESMASMSLIDRRDGPFLRRACRPIASLVSAAALTVLLVWLPASAAHAQGGGARSPAGNSGAQSWVHESWTVKDGLPVNSINALLQDRTGYIWLATFDGLVRFDGLRFTVFNSANSEALPSNRIIQLKEGRGRSLWLTTEQGHIVRFRDGRFTNIAFESGKPSGLATVVEDSAGGVWVGTSEGLWTVRRDTLVRVGRGTLDARITAIAQRRDGSVWVGTDAAGIFRVGRDGRLTRLAADPALDADFIARMHEDVSGTLWIAGLQALWRWGDRVVRVRGTRRAFCVQSFAEVHATQAVFAAATSGVYRVDADTAVRVRPPSVTTGMRLWADSVAIWDVAGQTVQRDGRAVFALPERRHVSTALFDREGSL